MARARNSQNGRLEEVLANVAHNHELLQQNFLQLQQTQQHQEALQAALQQQMATMVHTQAEFVARMSESDARMAEMDRRIERRFANIEAILTELLRMMERLPEAVREQIGFKPAGPQPTP